MNKISQTTNCSRTPVLCFEEAEKVFIFAMLLGVLSACARLRSYPMNLICIMTAQGNGIGIHCFGFNTKPYSLCCIMFNNNENHYFQQCAFSSGCCCEG